MSHKGWILLAVVLGVVVVGYALVNSASFSKLGHPSENTSTLGNVASIFKSTTSLFGDVEKAFPSWFGDGGSNTPSDADLNSYPSSSGFASTPDFS